MRPLLTIAGHDPVHGAGITADLATWHAMGLPGSSVVTALTVQDSHGLSALQPAPATLVRDALQALLRDGEPAAIKLGMLGSLEVLREVHEFVAARRCPVVLDPVLGASNGRSSHDADEHAWIEAVRALAREVDVITPNLQEAQRLGTLDGPAALVLKGGHADGDRSIDEVIEGARRAWLSTPRVAGSAHGSGCVFSAALAGALAQGWGVFDAACVAKLHVTAGLAQARDVGPGRPNMNAAAVADSAHLPAFRWADDVVAPAWPFAPVSGPLGFYAVLPDADWIARALAMGVRTLQLRLKAGSLPPAELHAQLRAAVRATREVPGAQLFINDHWREALELGAYGVHLGQEDIATADLGAIQSAGLRLGVSSHTPLEMCRAHALRPSYIAIGPVYPTTLKAMAYEPVGLQRLALWASWLKPAYPVVAIGGISQERAPQVMATGVDSIAVVSALTQAADPQAAAAAFVARMPIREAAVM
ncbi:bifunctional hydroxymethylpyrimidine kinase/phosphomethylpyrimidine kinase [Rhizobacter sp. P5_C2]